MNITFVHLPGFTRNWVRCGLSDEDLQVLENQLMKSPEAGVFVSGAGGLRKVRFAPKGRGKSGANRVGYAYFRVAEQILLISVFAKNDKENFTAAEKAEFKVIIEALKPKEFPE
jgi:hypothetical protein